MRSKGADMVKELFNYYGVEVDEDILYNPGAFL